MKSILEFLLRAQVRIAFLLFWLAALMGFLTLPYIFGQYVEDRSLSLYVWADRIDESILYKFEQDTGIKIYINYYDSNEELLTKLEIEKNSACDIVLPSGYIVDPMIKSGLLKKIDKSKCNFVERINPAFMRHFFDPENDYSLPLYWDTMGIGYTHSFFPKGLPMNSWKLIFDKESVPCKKISMIDDSRESLFLATQYFGYGIEHISKEQLKQFKNLFIQQKQWVGVYTDFQQAYYLMSHTYPVAVGLREFIAREMVENDDIGFIIPEEGSLLTIDNVAIVASSNKDELVYELINYLYEYNTLMSNCKEFSILPAVDDVLNDLPQKHIGIEGILPGQKIFKRLKMLTNILTQKQINDLWIAFKGS